MRFDRRRRLRARELRQDLAHRLNRLRLRRAQWQPFPDNVRLRPAAAHATFRMDAQRRNGEGTHLVYGAPLYHSSRMVVFWKLR